MGWVPRHALKPGSGPETPTRLPAPSPPSPASEVKGAQGSPGVLRLVSCAGSEDDLVSALETPPCAARTRTRGAYAQGLLARAGHVEKALEGCLAGGGLFSDSSTPAAPPRSEVSRPPDGGRF